MKKNLNFKVLERLNLMIVFALLTTFFSCTQEDDLEEAITGANDEFVVASLTSSTVQAENYDAQSGIQIAGGSKVGYINNGDWIRFDDFDFDGANSVSVRAASNRSGGNIEFRAGGTNGDLLGTVSITNTGSWNNMQTFTGNMNDNSNNSDLYLIFKGGNGYLFDVDSFVLSGNDDSGSCDLPWTDSGFRLANGTQAYRKTVDISCESNVTLSLVASGTGNMETADYMRIYYKVDGGSQQTIYTKNDSFSEQSFSVGNIQGNSLEIIVDAKNSASNEVHTLSNVRVSTDNPQPPTGGSAADIIGGMNSKWKLNAFSGSLNVGSGDYGKSGSNGLSYSDRASTSDNDNWFFETNGYAAFKCHAGNPTSSGSGNMRSELRELDGSGDERSWNGTTSTTHRMRYKVQIRRMPTSGKLCFGQIHGSGNFDDVIRLQIDDSSADRGATTGKTSGTYDVMVKGYVTENLDPDRRNDSWARIQMNREYDVEISMTNKKVTVKFDGSTIYTSMDVNSTDNYFKAGAYLQSAQFDKTPQLIRNNNNFGEVWIKDLIVD
ncbi:MAG: polysaccharide lyase family 7 protein [Maribacter sp.]|nr:polysaccharide lyase family 7 protein [Maribacter sp.]